MFVRGEQLYISTHFFSHREPIVYSVYLNSFGTQNNLESKELV